MKKLFFIIFVGLLPVAATQAKIRRVNNNAGVTPVADVVYANLGVAVAAANPGDTIHLEGSVTPYTGDVTVDKKVVIIGPGYLLGATAQTQYLKEPARLNCNITFDPGSEGSVIAGVEQHTGIITGTFGIIANPATTGTAGTYYAGNRLIIHADTVKVINCKLYFIQIENTYTAAGKTLSNVAVQKCFFNPGVISVTGTKMVASLSITNCFFRNDHTATLSGVTPNTAYQRVVIDGRGTGNVYPLSGVRISNNTFYTNFSVYVRQALFANNAFYATNTTAGNVESHTTNSYTHNVMGAANIGGMTNGVSDNSVRVESLERWFSRSGNNESLDIYYTSATNTTDCPLRDGNSPTNNTLERGMYGGGTSYVPSGMFRIPSVYNIVMDNEVGDQFDMTIHARVH
jgi:hypothetical protein